MPLKLSPLNTQAINAAKIGCVQKIAVASEIGSKLSEAICPTEAADPRKARIKSLPYYLLGIAIGSTPSRKARRREQIAQKRERKIMTWATENGVFKNINLMTIAISDSEIAPINIKTRPQLDNSCLMISIDLRDYCEALDAHEFRELLGLLGRTYNSTS